MAIKGIREYDGKKLLSELLPRYGWEWEFQGVLVTPETDIEKLPEEHPWLGEKKLVAKPDMLFGKRGKLGLISVGKDWKDTAAWLREHMNKEVTISGVTGPLTEFLVEPFVEHTQDQEYYIAMRMFRDGDRVYFSRQGGVNIEENWDSVTEVHIPVQGEDGTLVNPEDVDLAAKLGLGDADAQLGRFLNALYRVFAKHGFAYLEINPMAVMGDVIVPLDLVAKLDDTAAFENLDTWGRTLTFPAGFGRKLSDEEAYIKELDSKTGASLKLTILNPKGRIWPMVAGGGASVIYADTVADLGFASELAYYGEYSGNPNEELTYQYAKTILDLMTREHHPEGKALLIGGGIANFTDVAATFKGIIRAIREYADKLREGKVQIFVRRGGPNYKVGLERMRQLGEELGIPIHVHGPETHMTRIVPMALEALGLMKGE